MDTIVGYTRALRRHLSVFVVCLLGVPAVALAVSLLQQEQYTSTASLLLRPPGPIAQLAGTGEADPIRGLATDIAVLDLPEFSERASAKLDGEVTPGVVSEATEVAATGTSDLVEIQATHEDPQAAAAIANTVARVYVEFRQEAVEEAVARATEQLEQRLSELDPQARRGRVGQNLQNRLADLELIGSVESRSANLVSEATPPSSPSSPRPLRNTAIGFLFGGLLGLALVVGLEWLKTRLKTPAEAAEMFGVPLLGTVPAGDFVTATNGARAFEEARAFQVITANLRFSSGDGSILVISPSIGDGKSTVAWNLAHASASTGADVLLIEANLRHPVFGRHPEIAPMPGVSQVLSGAAELDAAKQTIRAEEGDPSSPWNAAIDLIPAGETNEASNLMVSDRLRDLLNAAKQTHGIVVIDAPPPTLSSESIPLLKLVDAVVVVVRIGETTRKASVRLREQLRNLDAPVFGVVANGTARDRYP